MFHFKRVRVRVLESEEEKKRRRGEEEKKRRKRRSTSFRQRSTWIIVGGDPYQGM